VSAVRVHLVDGTYELFRAYYGAPSATAPDGTEVGAVRTLALQLLKLARVEGVTHLGIAFDHVIESFRNGLFAGYKTGAGLDPLLFAQFPLAEELAAALGFAVWPMVEFEADDALATAAARLATDRRVTQVRIASPDKDLCQCVLADRVVSVDTRRGQELDAEGVRAKFGVPPASIPDWLALVGDDADGIPGLPGWGAKSAATVLARYGHLEAVPDDPGEWDVPVRGAARLAATLAERRVDARLYRTLATLRTDVPLAEDLDGLRWSGPDLPALEDLARRLGDPRLPARAVAR